MTRAKARRARHTAVTGELLTIAVTSNYLHATEWHEFKVAQILTDKRANDLIKSLVKRLVLITAAAPKTSG